MTLADIDLDCCPWDCEPGDFCEICDSIGYVYLWWVGGTEHEGGHWTCAPLCLCGEPHSGRWTTGPFEFLRPQGASSGDAAKGEATS